MSLKNDDDPDKWFTYLLEPGRLVTDISTGTPFSSLKPLLHDFLTNLLNNQTAGFFNENPQELWFAKSEERKCSVLRSLCLRLGTYNGWCLKELEEFLPPPLLLFLLTSLVQIQPGQVEQERSLANTNRHLEIEIASLVSPGPALQSLALLHRWVVRTYMMIKTPVRMERTSNVMVPGVKRDPAIIYRDQTYTLVSAVAPTSFKFLQSILDMDAAPVSVPTYKSFPTTSDPGSAEAWSWDVTSLRPGDRGLFLALVAYDLGRCYLFCEEYAKARLCFSKYFEHAGVQMREESRRILNTEIDAASLAGYLMVLDMTPPEVCEYRIKEPVYILGKLECENKQEGKVKILQSDDMSDTYAISARESFEEELLKTSGQKSDTSDSILPKVQIHNIIKRTMLGLPLSIKDRTVLSRISDQTLLPAAILNKHSMETNKTQKELLKMLVIELGLAGIISGKSELFKAFGVGDIKILRGATEARKSKISSIRTFKIESFGYEKIEKLNNSLQLLSTFNSSQIPQLIASLGGKNVRRITNKWSLESEQLARQKNMSDPLFITLAKVGQLKRMKRFSEAREMLDQASKLGKVDADQLLLRLEDTERPASPDTLASIRESDSLARLGHAPLTLAALTSLCNSGDWEAVTRLSHPNLPHVTSLGQVGQNPQATVVALIRHVSCLMTSIRANNVTLVKKHGRDIWELVASVAQSGPIPGSKRSSKETNIDTAVVRADVVAWMRSVTHDHCARILTSLLASLFNVVRDDPNTDILSPDGGLWPTHVTQALQDRTVEDMLTSVLTSALASQPHDPSLVRMMADLQFANSQHASALALYVETAALKTEFYLLELGPGLAPSSIEEGLVSRMVTCAKELGRLTQAVVLGQFTAEPNYAQIFKFLEDKTVDGSDLLYGLIWDMAILEFAMSLHTKRGEVAKRRQALQCIWQLELNTNNDEEILKEAANIRKKMFFRSLSSQLF